jgi:DNA repair protein RecO (recombination protein O)
MTHNLRAVVLWSRRSREADKIVGLFTDRLGRLTARATSAARPTAKFAALTEPFVESEISLFMRPGQGWGKLVGGQILRSFPCLRTHVERSTAAAWVCEIMTRMTPEEQPSPEKFVLLVETLEAMETAKQFTAVRLAFAVRFLQLAGFSLENRSAWQELTSLYPDRAKLLLEAPLSSFGDISWRDPAIKALESLAGAVVSDYLNRPLHVNRFRQMMGIEI